MFSPLLQEQKSFYFYILLLFITSLILSVENISYSVIGIITILWGLFGFFRCLYFNALPQEQLPNILTLPSRILFGLNKQKEQSGYKILDRFLTIDCLIFFTLALLYVGWGVYNTLYPLQPTLMQSFLVDKQELIDLNHKNYFSLLTNLTNYFLIILIFINGMTYSVHNNFLKITKIIFFVIIILFVFLMFSFSDLKPYMNFSYLKGIGWENFEIFKVLISDKFEKSNSGFVKRYVEMGLIGAYGLYAVFLPIFFVFIKLFFGKQDILSSMAALILLTLLITTDYFLLWHPFMTGFQVMALGFLACQYASINQTTIKS